MKNCIKLTTAFVAGIAVGVFKDTIAETVVTVYGKITKKNKPAAAEEAPAEEPAEPAEKKEEEQKKN